MVARSYRWQREEVLPYRDSMRKTFVEIKEFCVLIATVVTQIYTSDTDRELHSHAVMPMSVSRL